ncbi:MAG: hypothetical protein M1813_007524 [Trichoglossum hirsutum]|nr:MAG: hypothetical protein M1813_007524 [Trichoglossum hirsutum]
MTRRNGKSGDKLQNVMPGSYPGNSIKANVSWAHGLAGDGSSSSDFSVGGQFSGARTDLPQRLSFDEEDDYNGPQIPNGEVFLANLPARNLSGLSLQERENDHSLRSLKVEGVGGMSTALSETYVETQNGESSRDGALRNQKLTPSESNPEPLKIREHSPNATPNATLPIILPKPYSSKAFKTFFIKYAIVLGILLTVIIPVSAGVAAGILRKNLAVGIGVAAAFFLPVTVAFTLSQVLWKREERKEKAKEEAGKSRAAAAEGTRMRVDPQTIV